MYIVILLFVSFSFHLHICMFLYVGEGVCWRGGMCLLYSNIVFFLTPSLITCIFKRTFPSFRVINSTISPATLNSIFSGVFLPFYLSCIMF